MSDERNGKTPVVHGQWKQKVNGLSWVVDGKKWRWANNVLNIKVKMLF